MHKSQRANAIQKARAAEAAVFQLTVYLDDIAAADLVELASLAASQLRQLTKTLASTDAENEKE